MEKHRERFAAEQDEMSSLNLDELDVLDTAQRVGQQIISMLDPVEGCRVRCNRKCPNN